MAPPRSAKLNDISDELKRIIDANFDKVFARRRAREAFEGVMLSIDHSLFKVPTEGLKIDERYEKNSRGVEIFSKSWLPESHPPKGIICYCHGYGESCTFFFEGTARKLASAGYGVFALDYPGFGLSDGLHGYIPSFESLVDDVTEHYSKIKADKPEFHALPSFLFGQSMGGAVALKVHLKQPKAWSGAILLAPMCKIADDLRPPYLVTRLLIALSKALPKSKLVPSKDLDDIAFHQNKELTAYNIIAYKDKPRLRTAVELLHVTEEIERRLQEVSLPLLILHGEADALTDPSVSKALFEKASTRDKKLNLYKNACHQLLEGEPDEVVFGIFNDIISWLDDHSSKDTTS
ncbi:caffeoylshikimate esterase isoform X1 [Spinacia oleracea]|uniref:Caffeoylshikimate esterase isoform X1 n=1 Tax=Spinacia oleracea TaxID=3562 RepID=A0ABM3QLT9_SPIOL|nr:caffeoylshikimate esterase-like isoform X1 [Spinacia oleracea]XP_056684324.1 caffeoylshikimate esterase-like isoform X1 [Spinacia oleracea]